MGLYVVLPSAAQADLDRLHGETRHSEALFAYSTDQKIFLAYSPEGTTCPICSERHSCITCCTRQCTECMRWSTYIYVCGARVIQLKDVYIRLWRWMCWGPTTLNYERHTCAHRNSITLSFYIIQQTFVIFLQLDNMLFTD